MPNQSSEAESNMVAIRKEALMKYAKPGLSGRQAYSPTGLLDQKVTHDQMWADMSLWQGVSAEQMRLVAKVQQHLSSSVHKASAASHIEAKDAMAEG